MHCEEIAARLKKTRAPIDRLNVPAEPGVYAIFVREAAQLRVRDTVLRGLIYLGTSGDIASRLREWHFKSGGSRFSTLRRSLVAC